MNLETVIEKLKPYLSNYLQEQGIDTSSHFNCIYPDHEDSTPSCHISSDGEFAYCYGCNKSLNIFKACSILEDKPSSGSEWITHTVSYLAGKYGLPLEQKKPSRQQLFRIGFYKAYEAASQLVTPFGHEGNDLFNGELGKRQWTTEQLSGLSVGTTCSYPEFRKSMIDQGFSSDFLKEIGLDRSSLFNPTNFIYVWKDEKNRPVHFHARSLNFEEKKSNGDKKATKCLSTRTINDSIFKKDFSLYGIDRVDKSKPVWIFEGQADVVTGWINDLNCVAVGCTNFNENHIQLLKSVGAYDIVLCLDADKEGQKAVSKLVNKLFQEVSGISIKIVNLPEDDPDSFIRENGIQSLLSLPKYSVFEWKLNSFPEDMEDIDICKEVIPLIVNQESVISRDSMIKSLSERTGVSFISISQEVQKLIDEKNDEHFKDRKRLLDKAIYDINKSPADAETILQNTQSQLAGLVTNYSSDPYSSEGFLSSLKVLKEQEEKEPDEGSGYNLSPDLFEFEEFLRGNWSSGTFIALGALANSGKTALLSKLAYDIATYNSDVTVIYLSIDDLCEQLVPRFVTLADESQKLTINMVRNPNYWNKVAHIDNFSEIREAAYERVFDLVKKQRLIVKDITHGSSLTFAENLIRFQREQDRKVVFLLDSLHKLRDFPGKDERVRFKEISETIKAISLRNQCCFASSVQYTKLLPGVRPTDNNIAETGQIHFDTSVIVHAHNEMNSDPNRDPTVFHQSTNWKGEEVILPRVEYIVSKNKVNSKKGSFFLDFYPDRSDFKRVYPNEVNEQKSSAKEDSTFGELF